VVPPQRGLKVLHPRIKELGIVINGGSETIKLPDRTDTRETQAAAGVSAFSLGGSLAHAIIQSPPHPPPLITALDPPKEGGAVKSRPVGFQPPVRRLLQTASATGNLVTFTCQLSRGEIGRLCR
jgi:acyl transferase domain-containing protein